MEDFTNPIYRRTDFYEMAALGKFKGYAYKTIRGFNGSVGTTLAAVANSGTYEMPAAAVSLEVLSDNLGDAAAGAGARTVTVYGLTGTGTWIPDSETVTMNGLTPVALTKTFNRVTGFEVTTSGAYAQIGIPSQLGNITLRQPGPGATWALIPLVGTFGSGEAQIGWYTCPPGKRVLILATHVAIGTASAVNVYWASRKQANNNVAPFEPLKLRYQSADLKAVSDGGVFSPDKMIEPYTDFGFMALGAAVDQAISTGMEILEIDESVI